MRMGAQQMIDLSLSFAMPMCLPNYTGTLKALWLKEFSTNAFPYLELSYSEPMLVPRPYPSPLYVQVNECAS